MSVRKGWLIFALVLIVAVELAALSSFHYVAGYGYAYGGTVVVVAKWDYVQAWVRVLITPVGGIGAANVEVILPNGTSVNLSASPPTSVEAYTFTLKLPRTGDFLGSEAIAGPFTLSPTHPLNFTVENNVGNVTDALDALKAAASPRVDIYFIVIYGDAQVYVEGYGVAL